MPVLAVAVGLYLPFELDSSIFVGGVIAWLLERAYRSSQKETKEKADNAGLLIASGLITGEALMGILIALLATFGLNIAVSDEPIGGSTLGLLILIGIVIYLYRAVLAVKKQ